MIEETYEADGLRLTVPVEIEAGAAITDLSGATSVAVARRKGGTESRSGATAIAGNEVKVAFAPGELTAGVWWLQVRVTAAGETQTVLNEDLRVLPSL